MVLERGVSVVVPCFRSERSLPLLVDRILPVLIARGVPFEVILVDDGSGDRTWSAIERLADQSSCIRGLGLARNFGQHNALLAGIRAARFDVCVTLDDDLQNPPEEIPRLLAALGPGMEVVYGTPRQGKHGLMRNLASWITKQALRTSMNTPAATKISAFRAFRTELRESFADYRGAWVSVDVLLSWGTEHFHSVSVRHEPRLEGRSGYSIWKLFMHAMNMITGFSTIPLRLATLVGLTIGCGGFFALAYVVLRYVIQGGIVPGFAFLACALSIFSGVQLIMIGVMGEYLGRVFTDVSGRPAYTINRTVGLPAPK